MRTHSIKILLTVLCATLAALVLSPVAGQTQSSKPKPQASPAAATKTTVDYNRFTHPTHSNQVKIPGTDQTRELKCNYCHERANAGTGFAEIVATTKRNQDFTVKFPGHKACADCHIVQFTGQPVQTCSICHDQKQGLNARPPQRDFPDRRSYNALFDAKQHDLHDAYKLADGKKLDCAYCHKPTPKGAAITIASHPECYTCHTPQSFDAKANQSKNTDCAACHTQPATNARPFSDKLVSKAYGARFAHNDHVKFADCAACHTVQGGYNQKSPTSPSVKQHNTNGQRGGRGCFTCHDGKSHYGRTVFSGEDTNSCGKCHNTQGEIRVPNIRG